MRGSERSHDALPEVPFRAVLRRVQPAVRARNSKAMKSLIFGDSLRLGLAALVIAAVSMGIAPEARGQFGPPPAGVEINPDGILRIRVVDRAIDQQKRAAAKRQIDSDLAAVSDLRKVSLNRLEGAIAECLSRGESPTEAMRAMAGLTAVRYVFYYPETQDIVFAGPAEGFYTDATGRVRGTESGMPTILLEDVVTALRAYPPGARGVGVIKVSIDPTEEGLRRYSQVVSQVGSAGPRAAQKIAETLKNSLGLQTVSIDGIPATTHFAQVLVEADYRMKLIGIGLERLPMNMASFTDRSLASSGSATAMERWYFEPSYDALLVSEDGLGMELAGNAVRLVGAAEMVAADGQRKGRGRGNPASEEFCAEFTSRFSEIAEAVPVYAQLRQLIDLSIAAAFLQQQDYATQAGWEMAVLMDESQFPVETYTAPHQVETAVNAVWKGNTLLTPLGGGVEVRPKRALQQQFIRKDDAGKLVAPRDSVAPRNADPQAWWWD